MFIAYAYKSYKKRRNNKKGSKDEKDVNSSNGQSSNPNTSSAQSNVRSGKPYEAPAGGLGSTRKN